MITQDAERLASFYERVLGCARIETRRLDGAAFERRVGAPGGGAAVILRLGDQILELVQLHEPGRPYPESVSGEDTRFQHVAIVVGDMAAAFAALEAAADWTPITERAPVRLPPSSGGVTAFKFRDPDGHPAELLAFAADRIPPAWRGGARLFKGVDHSAISVADAGPSARFYEGLGMTVSARSHNVGPEQARLDGIAGAEVEVVALSPAAATPHVELLAYRTPAPRAPEPPGPHDVAATRLIFTGTTPLALADPDGHRLIVIA
jgi:catechol 2,3-dioxygenase-like lactoylglutathione lyase family enzyme